MDEEEKMKQLRIILFDVFTSPNESDRNGEIANITDGLFAISRSIYKLAETLKEIKK